MDGLARPSGAPVDVTFKGETLLFGGVKVKYFGTIEQHLLKQRPSLIKQAADACRMITDEANTEIDALQAADPAKPDEVEARRIKAQSIAEEARLQADSIMSRAFAESRIIGRISREECAEWIDTIEGVSFTLWLDWSDRYPGKYTLKDITDEMTRLGEDFLGQMIAVRDQASGTDLVGNSTGSPTAPTATGPSIGE